MVSALGMGTESFLPCESKNYITTILLMSTDDQFCMDFYYVLNQTQLRIHGGPSVKKTPSINCPVTNGVLASG